MKNPVLIIIFLALIAGGCSKEYDWENPLDPGNNIGPNIYNMDPVDSKQGVDTCIAFLGWWVADPNDGDAPISCDVYFGTMSPPPYVGVSKTWDGVIANPNWFYYEGIKVQSSTKYYWNIVAYDNHGKSTTGPIWSFTTMP